MKKPNIIYILADDLGYGDVSCLNEKAAFKTPNIDMLFQKGIAFTDAHATSAVCTPSRYSILTGRYNWRSRLKKGVLGGFSAPLIETGRTTAASYLKEQGYRTAAIGKWHLGMDFAKNETFSEADGFEKSHGIEYDLPIENGPNSFGFDYFFGINGSLDMPPYVYIENDRFTQTPDHETEDQGKRFYRRGPAAPDFRHEDVLDRFTEKVLDQISAYKNDPFFIYYPLTAPHTPILPAARFQGKSHTNEYGDFVLACDEIVGRIINKLKQEGLYEKTLLIFTSDNGCSPLADFNELAQFGHNPSYVFRGHKADIYEGGHRIPLLLQWPDQISGQQVCTRTVSLVDFMATLADILQAPLPESAAEDSISNLPLWLGMNEDYVRQSVVQQSIDGSLSLRKGRYKLVMCPGSGGWSWPQSGVEVDGAPELQLYDLEDDISERNNLALKLPDIVGAMRRELAEIVRNGRSTPGQTCANQGEPVWDSVAWLSESDSITD